MLRDQFLKELPVKCELAIYVSAYTTAKGLPSKNILGQKVNIQRFLSHLPRGARHSTSAVVRVEAASRAWLIIGHCCGKVVSHREHICQDVPPWHWCMVTEVSPVTLLLTISFLLSPSWSFICCYMYWMFQTCNRTGSSKTLHFLLLS